MLFVQDLLGNQEVLIGFSELRRNRKVNGEKTLSFILFPLHKEVWHMVETESVVTFDNEEYVIKQIEKKTIGHTQYKRITAIHKFYVDMINKQQRSLKSGSLTFSNALKFIFEDMPYTYNIIGTFYAQTFENLGNDNRLSLLQTILERYEAEIEIVGSVVNFRQLVGNDTDFQFRYRHNINELANTEDTTNLATVIRGTGANGITAYYRSENADLFGEIDAPSIDDERFTTEATLLEEMKSKLQDTPNVSITIDFVDLRSAGYLWTTPNEGDRIFVIYEPLDDLNLETRILEIDEVFDESLKVVKSSVTLSNYKKNFVGTQFEQLKKELGNIVNKDGIIKYSVLDEAVRIATEAIQSAQTELEFVNGIIAREKTDPNKLVVLNSAGLGISEDGGNTFKTAITSKGIVADVITTGTLRGIIIEGVEIIGSTIKSEDASSSFTVSGGEINLNEKNGRHMKLDSYGVVYYDGNGDILFQSSKKMTTSDIFGTAENNVYLASHNESRSVTYETSLTGSGAIADYVYVPHRAYGYYGQFLETNSGTSGANIYIRPASGYEARITVAGTTDNYRPVRAGGFYGNWLAINTATEASNLYAQVASDGVFVVETVGLQGNNNFRPVRASDFITASSEDFKENILKLEESSLDVINGLSVVTYDLINGDKDQIGIIAEESQPVASDDGKSVSLYKIISHLVKGMQELDSKIKWLEQR